MKLFSVSIGLLLAAMGIFYVPVSFSVDGFGLVVNPGGVRTIRATDPGVVIHYPSQDGRFMPGQIVTAVYDRTSVANNGLLEGTMRRELAKIESDHLERVSKIELDLGRDRAKLEATKERLAARTVLRDDTSNVLNALQAFNLDSDADIDELNAARLDQLARLEELVKRSGEVSALPAQKLATMMEDIQGNRLAVITSKGTKFSSDKMVLDMVKTLHDLNYDNSIDASEIEILSERLENLKMQIKELELLRDTTRAEAEARYLAKAMVPQVALSEGVSLDMRTLQASRANVDRTDALRLLATGQEIPGLSILIYGQPDSGTIDLRLGQHKIELPLPVDQDQIAAILKSAGLPVGSVRIDRQSADSFDLISVYAEFTKPLDTRLSIEKSTAKTENDLPVLVIASVNHPSPLSSPQDEDKAHEIVGFLENRHAVVLRPGQKVRGSISDTRTGSDILFDAVLLDRDFSTVDTKELGIRLGNESLAGKIIKRGVLSQVVVGVSESSAQRIDHLPGAVVHLSFPLARQSLFSFLLARNAAI